ncbi:MAG: metal ABC transporter substrate-binding protein [Planctomycetota bacterium]
MLPLVIGLVAIALVAPSCNQPTAERRPGPLRVVATTSIVADLVAQVGGTHIELTTLVGPDSDPHTFQPALQHGRLVHDADLIMAIGLGSEPWLDGLRESSGGSATLIELAADFPGLISADDGDSDHDEHDHDEHAGHDHGDHDHDHHDHQHGPIDPHIWHDVKAAIHMTGKIRDALIAAEPANESAWRTGADAALARLATLDAWVVEQVATIPAARRLLVTAHATHNYFAHRYGFRVVADLVGSTSTSGHDPSLESITRLVAAIKEQGVPAVFAENTSNRSVIDNVARDAGVPVHRLHTDALGKPGSGADTYDAMIRSNVRTIVDAVR